MNKNDMSVLQGGNLPLTVERLDPAAISATLILKIQGSDTVLSKSSSYDGNGVADVSLNGDDTAVPGVYDYQINENFSTGDPDKYPNPDKCSGEFSFPTITIYESLDGVEN